MPHLLQKSYHGLSDHLPLITKSDTVYLSSHETQTLYMNPIFLSKR